VGGGPQATFRGGSEGGASVGNLVGYYQFLPCSGRSLKGGRVKNGDKQAKREFGMVQVSSFFFSMT
jgi:hypothetical protein